MGEFWISLIGNFCTYKVVRIQGVCRTVQIFFQIQLINSVAGSVS